jgi:hypothetical protein
MTSKSGEPLWLSGKVMEWVNKRNRKIPGLLPSPPGNLFRKKRDLEKLASHLTFRVSWRFSFFRNQMLSFRAWLGFHRSSPHARSSRWHCLAGCTLS